jgi:hypothetical protein
MTQDFAQHFVDLPRRGLASYAVALGFVGMILPRVGIVFSGAEMPLRGGARGL